MARTDTKNTVELEGRITEVTHLEKGGVKVNRFRLIRETGRCTDNGEWEVTDSFWIGCVAFGSEENTRLVDRVARLKKGQMVKIVGRLQSTDPWTDDSGVKHGAGIEIVLSDVYLTIDDLASFELQPRRGAPQEAEPARAAAG